MLYKNNSKSIYIFYDSFERKHVIKPTELIEDSIVPDVINMRDFVPYGVKRTPKLPMGDTSHGNR